MVIQDFSDKNISGVRATIVIDGTLYPEINTTTDINGTYLFDASYDLKPNHSYAVQFSELPTNTDRPYLISPQNIGDDSNDSDIDDTNTTDSTPIMYSGESNITLDAGYYRLGSVGDRVWLDANGDGNQTSGEKGVKDVNVTLWYENNHTQVTHDAYGKEFGVVGSGGIVTTDANGTYLFDNLMPGIKYYVEFNKSTLPPKHVFTQIDDGDNDYTDSDANRTTGKTVFTYIYSDLNSTWMDAGIYEPVSIGDWVWYDANADGIQDSIEANVSNAKVELMGAGCSTLVTHDQNYSTAFSNTIYTDINGSYLFDNLIPGEYCLRFTAPDNTKYVITLDNNETNTDNNDSDINGTSGKVGSTTDYTLTSGEHNITVDAGFYKPVTIGDRVWIDRDYNGIQDINETNLSGVRVYLVVDDVVQDGNGSTSDIHRDTNATGYIFKDLMPGPRYSVKFDLTALNASHNYRFTLQDVSSADDNNDSDANATGYVFSATPISFSDDTNLSFDAGVYEPVIIGDFVWHDINGNGMQDTNEPGIADVNVTLLINGVVQPSIWVETNSTGGYLFDDSYDLKPDHNYSVQFTNIPANFVFTTQNAQGSSDTNDSDANRSGQSVTATPQMYTNDENLSLDAGIYIPASIGDRVWEDLNGNGIQDANETNVSDVRVTLYEANGTQVLTDIDGKPFMGGHEYIETNLTGEYLFTNLKPGSYYLEFNISSQAGFVFTNKGTGTATDSDANRTNGRTDITVLDSNETNVSFDAGIYEPVVIGDRAWIDANGNGIQDSGEENLSNVKVTLWRTSDNSKVTTDQNGTAIGTNGELITDVNGSYLFENLIPNEYYLKFTAPATYVVTVENNETYGDTNDSDVNNTHTPSGATGNYILNSGDDNRSVDAGFYIPVSVGDRVWIDRDYNGTQDSGEENLSDVNVTLYKDGLTTNISMETNASGEYLFTNLPIGHIYSVEFNLTDVNNTGHNYRFTQQNINSDKNDTNDSDVNILTTMSDPTPMMVSGEDNLTLDAGVYEPVIIGDFVWHDVNGNGMQDTNEPGIADVNVTLLINGVVQPSIWVETNSTGGYLFDDSYDLKPDHNYSVQFTNIPANFVFTTQNAQGSSDTNDSDANRSGQSVTATPQMYTNDENLSLDAGIYIPASIGDRVWEDLNGNGIQDANETNVSDVRVTLYEANGTQVLTDIDGKPFMGGHEYIETNLTGEYLFTNLKPGSYYLEFNISSQAGFVFTNKGTGTATDSDANRTSGRTDITVLDSNETNVSFDAGIYKPVVIGDRAWIDANGNGIQDSGEENLSNVKVTLWRTSDNSKVTTDQNGTAIGTNGELITDVNGSYLFENLIPNEYYLKFTAPATYVVTVENNETYGDTNDSDVNNTHTPSGATGNYVLNSGDDNRSVDAGFYIPVSVGDRVWIDRDYNGTQDSGEENLSDVNVTLYKDGLTTNISMKTNANGEYLFTNLPIGHIYSVEFNLTDVNNTGHNYRFTQQNINSDKNDTNDSDVNILTTMSDPTPMMVSGEDNLTLDAGVYEPVIIGDFVWHDVNGNGMQDTNEPGIADVNVTLLINGVVQPSIWVETNSTGGYLFDDSYDLKPDHNYSVQFTNIPANFVFTTQNAQGSSDTNDSDANRSGQSVTATPQMYTNDENLSLDAGIYIPASIGDRVWEDLNGNGIQDANETNVSDVRVTLYEANGTQVLTDIDGKPFMGGHEYIETNSTGEYLFANLKPGSYYLEFNISSQAGFVFTTKGTGTATDSDANRTNGRTDITVLDSNETNVSFDAGIYEPVVIGDRAWVDANGNGIQDSGEENLSNVKVTLWRTSDNSKVTTDQNGTAIGTNGELITDVNGSYLFENLIPNEYYLKFTAPATYVVTVENNETYGDTNDSDVNNTHTPSGATGNYILNSGDDQ